MPRRPSSVKKLPASLRKELDDMLASGALTLQQITDLIRRKGGDVSRSGVHRYSQSFDKLGEHLAVAREVGIAYGRDHDDNDDGDRLSAAAAHVLETVVVRGLMQMSAQGDEVDSKSLRELSASFKDAAAGRKSNLETRLKHRAAAFKEAGDVAAESLVKKHGLTQSTADDIRASILGIDARAT